MHSYPYTLTVTLKQQPSLPLFSSMETMMCVLAYLVHHQLPRCGELHTYGGVPLWPFGQNMALMATQLTMLYMNITIHCAIRNTESAVTKKK